MSTETQIVRMVFGSHLYGTNTDNSDRDYKEVRIPSRRDIFLQRAFKVKHENTKENERDRNTYKDIDVEIFSFQHWVHLLGQGQTIPVDMLFAPDNMILGTPHKMWDMIKLSRHTLISKRASSFVGYCRNQANKYGIKGSRMGEARQMLEFLLDLQEKHGPNAKLVEFRTQLQEYVANDKEHTMLVEIDQPNGPNGEKRTLTHLQCCQRKVPFTNMLKTAIEVYGRLFAEYGERARQAESNENIDWKAIMHAIRVGRQTITLFNEGEIVYPLPYADYLKHVKLGRIDFKECSEEIERLLPQVEEAAVKSPHFPDVVSQETLDTLVLMAYYGD